MESLFEQYQAIKIEIKQIERQIKRMDELINAPRISNLTGMPRSGKVSDGMDMVAKAADLKKTYEEKKAHLLDLQKMAEDAINDLAPDERVIMRCKYFEGEPNWKVGISANCSPRTVNRRVASALQKLKGD